MKKTKLLFSMLLAGCLVACGNNNSSNSSDNNSSNEPTSETTSTDGNSTSSTSSATPDSSTTSDTTIDVAVTEQKWQQILADFATARNFSLQQSVNGVEVGAMKLVGTTYYDVVDGWETIYEIDGDNYYVYDKLSPTANWTKKKTTEQQYNYAVNTHACSMVLAATVAFGTNYSSFEYSDGKYMTKAISVTEGFDLQNIEVTLNDDKLDKVICTMIGTNGDPDVLITVDNIGTTSIAIPNIQYTSVESIKLSKTETAMEFNSSIILTAEVYPENATNGNVKWESDNPKIVSVYDGIVVSGDIEGTATITATADGVSATCTITVVRELPLEEVTRERWVEIFSSLESPLTNYTLVDTSAGELVVDGTSYYYAYDGSENYYEKDGDNYYKYSFVDGNWTREMIDEKGYNTLAFRMMSTLLSKFDFASQYSQFTFENDVYYCPSLRASNIGMEKIKVAFKNGDLFYIQWGSGDDQAKLSKLGTTVVELPEKYIDIN